MQCGQALNFNTYIQSIQILLDWVCMIECGKLKSGKRYGKGPRIRGLIFGTKNLLEK
jgi:hypothetical protein